MIWMLWNIFFFFSSEATHVKQRRKLQGYKVCRFGGWLLIPHSLIVCGNPAVPCELWLHFEDAKSFSWSLIHIKRLTKCVSDVSKSMAKTTACWCCRMPYIVLYCSLKCIKLMQLHSFLVLVVVQQVVLRFFFPQGNAILESWIHEVAKWFFASPF